MTLHSDADRLRVPLLPLVAPLVVIGRQWCFAEPLRLRATSSAWLRSLNVKNKTLRETFVRVKHTLSATIDINTEVQPSAIYHVLDGKTKYQVLTVQRVGRSSTYDVHHGVFHPEDGEQPCVFSTSIHSANKPTNSTIDQDTIVCRDAVTGELCRIEVDGDSQTDRVGLVWLHKENRNTETGAWMPVARIHRPKRRLLESEYFEIEIAAGMDAIVIVMLWLARWGECQREKP